MDAERISLVDSNLKLVAPDYACRGFDLGRDHNKLKSPLLQASGLVVCDGGVRPTMSFGCSETMSCATGSSSAPSVVVNSIEGFMSVSLGEARHVSTKGSKCESISDAEVSNAECCAAKAHKVCDGPLHQSTASGEILWNTFNPIHAAAFESLRSEPVDSLTERGQTSRSELQCQSNPPSILKRDSSVPPPCPQPLTANKDGSNKGGDSKRSVSTLSQSLQGDIEAVQSLHRVNSAVRFQLPLADTSDARSSQEPAIKEKKGFFSFLLSPFVGKSGRPSEGPNPPPAPAPAPPQAEASPQAESSKQISSTAEPSSPLTVDKIVDPIVSRDRLKLMESFRSDSEDEDVPLSDCKNVVSGSFHDSKCRFETSGSPTGSFYFSGNSQVYIPDAPEDVMDIPPNLSFAGGGSFCSSPVVISNRLKAVDVSHNLQVLNDEYVLYTDKLIGKGSFGEVFLCYSISEEIYYAAKTLDRRRLEKLGIGTSNNGMERLLNEISIMQKLRHDNIIALREVINDSASKQVYLIMELAGYGPLLRLEKGFVEEDCEGNTKIEEATVKELVHSMVQALVYAHKLGIAHRDIKPDNLLLTNDSQLKVSDFGVSCLVDGKTPLDREGSIAFLPPEMLLPITKEKFIAASPHVHAIKVEGSGDYATEGEAVSLDHLLREQSPKGPEMAPLAMDLSSDSFAFVRSGKPDLNDPTDFVVISSQETGSPNASVKNIYSAHRSARNLSEACSPSLQNLSKGPENDRDNLMSPKTAVSRNSNVGWQYVNRNEIDLFKADVWAVGVTAFVMLHGRLPWLAHLDPIKKDEDDSTILTEDNITECLDPQSRFRLHLYQKWKSRQERRVSDSFADSADHSYLSPYRLGNASFTKPLPDMDHKLEYSIGGAPSLSSPVTAFDSAKTFCEQGPDKEDKQNVEYAFWKYWSKLVQDSDLGAYHPRVPTEKQLRAILCHPDPVTLVHTSSSTRRYLPKPQSWEVFVSSDDEAPCEGGETKKSAGSSRALSPLPRRRAKSIRVVDAIDTYLLRLQTKFGEPFGRCDSCSASASNFIRECLQLDPVVRPTMSDLLQHEWLADAKSAYEQRMASSMPTVGPPPEKMYAGIPIVDEEDGKDSVTDSLANPSQARGSNSKTIDLSTKPSGPTSACARPIAKEEIAHLPKQLPKLFNSALYKAGRMEASQFQRAFKDLLPTAQRRATDDSALLDLRHMQIKEAASATLSVEKTAPSNVFESASTREASPIRLLLGSQKGEMASRSLSLPARLDELDNALRLIESMTEAGPPPTTERATRKRTMTMAPVFMPGLDGQKSDSSPTKTEPNQ